MDFVGILKMMKQISSTRIKSPSALDQNWLLPFRTMQAGLDRNSGGTGLVFTTSQIDR
jgi:hypothetical protein